MPKPVKRKLNFFRKSIALITGLLLVLSSLLPGINATSLLIKQVLAEDSVQEQTSTASMIENQTPSSSTEEQPKEQASPEPTPEKILSPTEPIQPDVSSPIETPSPTPSPEPTKEDGQILDGISTTAEEQQSQINLQPEATAEPSAASSVTSTPAPKKIEKECAADMAIRDTIASDWAVNEGSGIAQTISPVALGVKYVFPKNQGVTVTFSCLPKDLSLRTPLKIQELKVTDLKLPDSVKPATDYIWDITTGMTDGTFAYDVTLPKPENKTAEVSFIEKSVEEIKTTEIKTDEVKQIEDSKINQEGSAVKVTNIDHFTIFIVSEGNDTTFISHSLNTGDINELKTSDNTRYGSDGHWPTDNYDDNQYIEFRFDPQLDSSANIAGVNLIFEYQRNSISYHYSDYKAKLVIYNSQNGHWETLSSDVKIDTYDSDRTFTIAIPNQYINTIDKINALKIRFMTAGQHSLLTGILTYHDYVALDITYSDATKMNICHKTASSTNPWEATRIDASSWTTHQGHGDFLYTGPTKPNGHPQQPDGDTWCEDHAPKKGTLIVKKTVVNNNGGTKTASNFSFQVNGGSVTAFEADGQNDLTLDAGTYTITEPAVSGYTPSFSNCSGVVLAAGGTQTCTITNDDIQPLLTVIKSVVNDNGGTKIISDFPLSVGTTPVTSGVQHAFNSDTYTITETGGAGYSATFGGACNSLGQVTLALGDVKTCTITNDDIQPKLTVTKIVHNTHGGTKTVADFPLKVNTTVVASGIQHSFNAGTYTVSETNQPGYTPALSGDCNSSGQITLHPGDIKSCIITNNDQPAEISGMKFDDKNGNGVKDPEDTGISGWTMNLDKDADGSIDQTATTDASGIYTFTTLSAGTYRIRELAEPGWSQTTTNPTDITVTNGETITDIDFGNAKLAKIIVDKNTNPSGDTTPFSFVIEKQHSESPERIDTFSLADRDTPHISENLLFGTYHVTETVPAGWKQTNATCINDKETMLDPESFTVTPGDTIRCTFENRLNPVLQISKTNDATVDKNPGESVLYTIVVRALANTAFDVKVTDLLPNGFIFRPGSWTATKNGSPLTLVNGAPSYHSPGTWELGSMNADDKVTLTLVADIDANQKAGNYKDIALAYGCNQGESCGSIGGADTVLAQAVSPGYVQDSFAGTDVTVVKDEQDAKNLTVVKEEKRDETNEERETRLAKEKAGQVLGASTLPATGGDTRILYLIAGLFGLGLISVIVGAKLMRRHYA